MLRRRPGIGGVVALAFAAVCGCDRAPPIMPIPLAAPPSPVAESGAVFFRVEQIVVPPAMRQPYNHTASIVAMPDGELLLAWGAGVAELARDTAIYLARRRTDGTWADVEKAIDTPNQPDANCVLFLDPAGGLRLYFVEVLGRTFCEGRTMQVRSDGGGRTWSSPQPLLPAVCTMIKNKPIVLHGGRWVLPAYIQAVYASQFWISDDAGETWKPGDLLLTLPNNLQPAVAQRSDGSLLALMRRGEGGEFTWQGESADGGVSWSLTPKPELLNPNSGLDLLRLSNGVFVTAYNDSATQRSPLVVRASLDEGRTWLPPSVISEGEGQRSYPTIAEGPDGMIHVVFSDRLEAIGHAEFNVAWIVSR